MIEIEVSCTERDEEKLPISFHKEVMGTLKRWYGLCPSE